MKLLRLTAIIVVALAVAITLTAPGFVGAKVAEVWQQQLARLRGGEMAGYERGWFGASARTRVASGDGTTELLSQIQHGPLLFTAGGPRIGVAYSRTRLSTEHLAKPLRTQLEQFYGRLEHSPVVLESLVGVDNRVRNTVRLEPFTRSDRGGELTFGGAELVLDTDYSGAVIQGFLKVGQLRRERGGREELVTDTVTGDIRLVPRQGDTELSLYLPRLRAETESGPLELRDLVLQVDGQLSPGGNLQLSSELSLPQVQSATPVTSVLHRLKLADVSMADLGHYISALALTPAGRRDWQQILVRPLKLQQQLVVESVNGPILMDLDADWAGFAAGNRRSAASAADQWLAPLVGSVTFSASEKALLQSPLVAQAMLLRRYGLLLTSGDELQMLVQVNRGKLMVNGQQLPPEALLAALLGRPG
ncbi:DUF945 family protein [Microbulbifer sp. 2201CG32-9]|uniref:DUF945 family protein n=1 Tax=Microbulbifer sp. 2201CG32-9 TaxID=3232309 RepID=UPI00345B5D59